MVHLRSLENISVQEIVDVFNSAFSDYFLPLKTTVDSLIRKFETEKVRLDLSVGAFDNDSLVGFVLHFGTTIDGVKILYNGGTGVLLGYRGQNLTCRMIEHCLPQARNEGFTKIQLEVLSINNFAISAYQKIGFQQVRLLDCYKGKMIPLVDRYNDFMISRINDFDWGYLKTFWDYLPTWQNAEHTLETNKNELFVFGAFLNEQIVGYIVFNPIEKRIHQLSVDKTFRKKGVASNLLNVIAKLGYESISFINFDSRLQVESFFSKFGLMKFTQQLEMELLIN